MFPKPQGQASGFGRNQAPKTDRLNKSPIWEFRNRRKSFIQRHLAKILWDFTYLCWANRTLRLCNVQKNILSLEFVFQDGRVMSPVEARYPEACHSWPLDDRRFNTCFDKPVTVQRVGDPQGTIPEDKRAYLLALGV